MEKKQGENQSVMLLITLAILVMAGLFFIDPNMGPSGETSITGRLDLMAKAENGARPMITVFTADDAYRVADDERGQELLPFANRQVEVRGTITIDRSGKKVLHVRKYKLL